jgi:hypothetical protein
MEVPVQEVLTIIAEVAVAVLVQPELQATQQLA